MFFGCGKEKKVDWQAVFRFMLAALIFFLIFWYPWQNQNTSENQGYFLSRDTRGYMLFSGWRDPWRSYRSIGYRLFLYPFLHHDVQKFTLAWDKARNAGIDVWMDNAKPLYSIAKETGIAKKFKAISLVQRIVEALAFSVFYLALCRWLPAAPAFIALLVAVLFAPPPSPYAILTEPLTCALTWFCAAFLLYAPKSTLKIFCVAMACLCASLAFLIGPRTLSLVGLCSLIFLGLAWCRIRERAWLRLVKSVCAFSPLMLAYAYIGWLSVTGGQVFLHTQWDVPYFTFLYLAEAEDIQYMPTERARKYAIWYVERKKDFFNAIKNGTGGFPKFDAQLHSPVSARGNMGNLLVYYGPLRESWKYFKNDKDIANPRQNIKATLGKELTAGLWHRHTGDIILGWGQNFIAGLGYYKDVYLLRLLPSVSFAVNMGALILAVLAIMLYPGTRWPIGIMVGIHIMAIIATAIGHFMIGRYVISTQPFLLIAGVYSLWFLCIRGYQRLKSGGVGVQQCTG